MGVKKSYKFVVRKQFARGPSCDLVPDLINRIRLGAETFQKLLHMALENLTEFQSKAEAIAVQSFNAVDREPKRRTRFPNVSNRPARFLHQ